MNENTGGKILSKDDPEVQAALLKLLESKNTVPEGVYEAEISKLEYRRINDAYKKRDCVMLVATFTICTDGDDATLVKYISLTWTEKSNLKKIAKATGKLPITEEPFDPDALLGATLMVSVVDVKKEERTFSNIEDFFSSQATKKASTLQPPKQAQKQDTLAKKR
jgi:hypothetical protein